MRRKILDDSGYATIASSGIVIAVVVLLAAVAIFITRVIAFHCYKQRYHSLLK